MKWMRLFIEDITPEHINFCDNYIKRTLINARRSFYRPAARFDKLNIIILGSDVIEEEVGYEDIGYERVYTTFIDVNGICVPIHNPDLAVALMDLPIKLRTVILRHAVLGHRLKDIAKDIGVSERMAGKYRKKALEQLKDRMINRQ